MPTKQAIAPGDLDPSVRRRAEMVREAQWVRRVWDHDPTVWNGRRDTPELTDRLGWLDLPNTDPAVLAGYTEFAAAVAPAVDRVVLCGMGGSSLAPEVLGAAMPSAPGFPSLQVLDSTVPAAVAGAEPGARDLIVIASKSGTTLETSSFLATWWERTGGRADAFVAITDPGTPLESEARAKGFAGVFRGVPEVGGRFSALSAFGLVPAALLGVDLAELMRRAAEEAALSRFPDPADNPALALGILLGEAASAGRDKLVLEIGPGLERFGLWLEQLIAESTGKNGKGLVPIIRFAEGAVRERRDAVIVRLALHDHRWSGDLDTARAPHVDLVLDGPMDLGGQFFRWEYATAVAGAILQVNPFDQPNVAEAKDRTRALLESGSHVTTAGPEPQFFDLADGEYLAVLAYVAPGVETDERLERLAGELARRLGGWVTWGYGPRYLHSTGQLHKGGPPAGRFVQVVPRFDEDVPIPGTAMGFAALATAQADGDYEALASRGLPIARVASIDELEGVLVHLP